jgi:hypothetical protein
MYIYIYTYAGILHLYILYLSVGHEIYHNFDPRTSPSVAVSAVKRAVSASRPARNNDDDGTDNDIQW